MPSRHCRSFIHVFVFILFILICGLTGSIALGQGAKQKLPDTSIPDADADHVQQRSEWFFRGRLVPRKPSAELRRRAYQAKLQMRALRAAASAGGWTLIGPAPLASDATGNGTQDYHQVAGRATAVAINPADSTGNTVFIGGAQSGVWKSTNAANNTANSVLGSPTIRPRFPSAPSPSSSATVIPPRLSFSLAPVKPTTLRILISVSASSAPPTPATPGA